VNSMPFDEANKGDPFRGDFPGRPDRGAWDTLAATVQRQLEELARLSHEPAIRHKNLTLLQQRRQPELTPQQLEQRTGSGPDDFVTQFDFLPVELGFDALLVPGELLITRQSYDSAGPERRAKDFFADLHLKPSEVDCAELRTRVLRLIPTRPMGPQELADAAKDLRAQGYVVSLINIIQDAAVVKPPPNPGPPPPPPGMAAGPGAGPGAPVKVAVIDTGITAEIRPDGLLARVPRDGNIDPLDAFPLPKGDGYLDFAAGHGTFVAGIIQQVAPGAEIKVYRAVDSDGIASEMTVASAWIQAVKDGAEIINLSLGCQAQDDVPPIALQAALDFMSEHESKTGKEVLVVAAAGNYADSRPTWPAAFDQVVSVAGLGSDMSKSDWSSRGPWVKCATIGQGVSSAYVEGRIAPPVDPVRHHFPPGSWAVWSGTSFAAPQITGALANLRQNHAYAVRDALGALLAAGTPVPGFGQAMRVLPGI
jgi:hypothetical protein